MAVLRESEPLAVKVMRMTPEERHTFYDGFSPEELERLEFEWKFWARPNQVPPGAECERCRGQWLTWLILAGRGWGKTRTGAEWIHDQAETHERLSLVGATAADARDIMVEGESGIMATARPWNKCTYYPSKTRIEWANGAWALVFSAEEPDRLRGKQSEKAWADELASWAGQEEKDNAWSQLQLGLRLGSYPQTTVTTTPRPTKLVRELAAAPTTHLTKGITYENLNNLAPSFVQEIIRVFEGQRFGLQEIYADILDDAPGALFSQANIHEHRLPSSWVKGREFERVVVAVDPAVTMTEDSDETGIVVAARDRDQEGYVLQDASGQLKPEQWANRVISLYHSWEADVVVAEQNQGGDMVKHTIQVYDPSVKVVLVRATKGKLIRAEPVSALYEKGVIHHVGTFEHLERQMTGWEPGVSDSPDRLDALVWAMTELLVGNWKVPLFVFGDNPTPGVNHWAEATGSGKRRPEWLSA